MSPILVFLWWCEIVDKPFQQSRDSLDKSLYITAWRMALHFLRRAFTFQLLTPSDCQLVISEPELLFVTERTCQNFLRRLAAYFIWHSIVGGVRWLRASTDWQPISWNQRSKLSGWQYEESLTLREKVMKCDANRRHELPGNQHVSDAFSIIRNTAENWFLDMIKYFP